MGKAGQGGEFPPPRAGAALIPWRAQYQGPPPRRLRHYSYQRRAPGHRGRARRNSRVVPRLTAAAPSGPAAT